MLESTRPMQPKVTMKRSAGPMDSHTLKEGDSYREGEDDPTTSPPLYQGGSGIDGETVLTGSFNFTKAAQDRNAENLMIIRDPSLAAQYTKNWEAIASIVSPMSAEECASDGGSKGDSPRCADETQPSWWAADLSLDIISQAFLCHGARQRSSKEKFSDGRIGKALKQEFVRERDGLFEKLLWGRHLLLRGDHQASLRCLAAVPVIGHGRHTIHDGETPEAKRQPYSLAFHRMMPPQSPRLCRCALGDQHWSEGIQPAAVVQRSSVAPSIGTKRPDLSRSVGRQEDGPHVDAELIRQGCVWASTRGPFQDPERCRSLEQEARKAGRGLWGRQ